MRLDRVLLLCVGFTIVSSFAWATTWNVAPTGCNDTSCAPCCTIQGAVEKSSGGDTVSVAPGTFPEAIDLRDMFSPGGLTLEASSGPGTVLVSPSLEEGIFAGSSNAGTVTIDGIDFTTTDSSCVWLAHPGDAVLRDVTANNCGYSAYNIDSTGQATMERCTGNQSARTGIQVDGASSATLTDCTTNNNTSNGIHVLNVSGAVEIVTPTTIGNTDEGVYADITGSLTVSGATIIDNDGRGVRVYTGASVTISGSTITGSFEQGIDIDWDGADSVDSVTLTDVDVSNNGHGGNEDGTRLRNVDGPVVLTNCVLDNNGADGIFCDGDVVGNIEISGGRADGNGDDGYDLRGIGNATVMGARASSNGEMGFSVFAVGTVSFDDCIANGNQTGNGFLVDNIAADLLDGVTVSACTANNNGLLGGGNGIIIKYVDGPVAVVGTTTNGNSRTGVRVDDTAGSVLIRDAESNFGLEEGFKIDADVGPVTVTDCVAEGNATNGLVVRRENVDVESLYVRRNAFVSNIDTGVVLLGLGGSGLMSTQCNDIADNDFGIYLDSLVTVDARKVWWGSATGPSEQGPGTGDGIYAEPGGTITFNPWLPESISSPTTTCEFFSSGFDSGLLEEWDVVVN